MRRIVYIILPFLFFACSPRQKPEPGRRVQVKVFEGKRVEIGGEKFRIKISRKKFRLFSPVIFYSNQGKKYYSLDLGKIEGDRVELSDEEFILPKEGILHLFHGKYSSKTKAEEEIKKLGEGFPVLLWEKKEGGIKVKLGKDWYYGEEIEVYPEAGLLEVEGRRYRGRLTLRETAKGLEVTNLVPLEDFLKGCGKAWKGLPLEAMKALAVVLRTTALSKPGVLSGEKFGYQGISGEMPDFSRAVEETREVFLTYHGRPIPLPFTLSCGGETENDGLPYLRRFRCWKRKKVVISSEIPHFSPGISILEALGLLRVDDEDQPMNSQEAQQWLWAFSRFISSKKFYPVEGQGRKAFFEALGRTLMEIKPGESSLPLEYLLDASIISEDDLKEEGISQGDVALFLYSALKYLGKIPWKEGKVEITQGRLKIEGIALKEPVLFRQDRQGLIPASVLLVFDGEKIRYLTDLHGEITALLGDGFSGEGEEVVWRKRYSLEALKKRLNYFFPVGEIQDLIIKDRLPSGRVAGLEVEGESDVYLLNEEEVMRFLGLPSSWFILDREYDDDGNIQGFFFIGLGRGRGRGLCLAGAKRMALEGMNFRQILDRYYSMEIKGVNIASKSRRKH